MTHKAIFRQHWSDAFRDTAFRQRLHDPDMAERWAKERFIEGFLPVRQRWEGNAPFLSDPYGLPSVS